MKKYGTSKTVQSTCQNFQANRGPCAIPNYYQQPQLLRLYCAPERSDDKAAKQGRQAGENFKREY